MSARDGELAGQLPKRAIEYLDELVAEIVKNGDPSGDIADELSAAHDRRIQFAVEMAFASTDRARKARSILCAKVYGTLVASHAINTTLSRMEAESGELNRLRALAVGYSEMVRLSPQAAP